MKIRYHKSKSFPFFQKYLRFNYQLQWIQQDQNACTNFPQVLTGIDFLPYFINNRTNTSNTEISHHSIQTILKELHMITI